MSIDSAARAYGANNLVELLRARATHEPSNPAYHWLPDGDSSVVETLTYAQLDAQARAIAAWLQSERGRQERALLLYPPGLEYIAAYFGCLYAGVIAVPAYPPRLNKANPRISAIVADAQAHLALTTDAIHSKLAARFAETPDLAAMHWLATDKIDVATADVWKPVEVQPETIAFLQYSSGTTRSPRGVKITHGNLVANSRMIAQGFEHVPDERGVFWLPIYHDMGLIGGVLQPMWIGRPTTLMPPAAFLQSPFRWLKAISDFKANVSGGPDMAYDLCSRAISEEQKKLLDLSHWDLAFTGAEPIRPATLDRFCEAFGPCGFRREAFYPCFGGAESTLIVTGGRRREAPPVRAFDRALLRQGRAVISDAKDATRLVGLGRPLGELQLRIVDPATREVLPEGRVGEAWLKGRSVGTGYWGDAQGFDAHTSQGDGGWMRTNDLAFVHDGELFFAARLSDVVTIGGQVYYPQDLEMAAEHAHPSLREGFGAAFSVERNGRQELVLSLIHI